MEELFVSIDEKIDYIKSNCSNAYILKECNIINIKLEPIRNKEYTDRTIVNEVCDKIINYDISNMSRTLGISDDIKSVLKELAELVEKIKTVYFE